MKFLFVDDDDDILDWYVELFQATLPQLEICTASDGKAALASCNAGHYSLIVTDNNMPGMNGEELVRHLRSGGSECRETPVVIVSGYDLFDNSGAEEISNVHRIQKPINGKILLRLCCELANLPAIAMIDA